MIRTNDGFQTKRLSGKPGDRQPTTGFEKKRALFTATGGETSINLALLATPLAYMPGHNQIAVKRSSGGGSLISGVDFIESSSTTISFPGDPLVAGEIIEVSQEAMVTGIAALAARPDAYTTTATAAQTLIIADFSWPYNLNAGKGIGAVEVFINGILQTRGVDFTEVNLSTANTNQVLLVDPLLGGENIILVPTYQPIDVSAASSSLANQSLASLQSMMAAGSQGFVDQSTDMIAVPNTTIVGRAKIPNLANDLRASLGIERIMTQGIVQLQNEFGLNGEPVYAAVNDDRGLIRFVGSGWVSAVGQTGAIVNSSMPAGGGDYLEVTFYGTGLNLLAYMDSSSRGFTVTLNGQAYSTLSLSGATILNARNYAPNNVVNFVTGQTLGIHTVKIMSTSTVIAVYGFEILNANASGLVNINPGVGYLNGQKYVNSAADSVTYNTGVTGTRGGRVVRYLNADGTVGQAFTAVDAASAYLALANHVNEEVVRTYHWREFGCGRADDFSLLTSTARAAAFTLDDGTTTLVGQNVFVIGATTAEGIHVNATNDFITFTFVGTGLDIFNSRTSASGAQYTVYVDGVSQGTNVSFSMGNNKICSGLAYGTHTVKVMPTSVAGAGFAFKNFTVYSSKKPTIPATALELCDYNVMADYGSGSSVATKDNMPTGTLRKALAVREAIYTGTWASSLDVANFESGWNTQAGASGSSVSYTFFGTGIEWSQFVFTNAMNATISIDGSSNLAGFTTALLQTSSGLSFTASTGALSGTSAGTGRIRLKISGLPLGIHTVRLVTNNANQYYSECLDIITPIHAVKSNLYADLQNTLPVGSCSLTDSRKTSLIKEILPAQKVWAQAVGVTGSPTTTSTSPVPLADMSVTIKTSGGPVYISYSLFPYHSANGITTDFYVYVDGSSVGKIRSFRSPAIGFPVAQLDSLIVPLAAGTHKVDLYWSTDSGTATSSGTIRTLTVQEL